MRILVLILATGALLSCKTEKTCIGYNQNEGLILREPNLGECYSLLQKQSYFINDSVTYKQLNQEVDTTILNALGCAANPDKPSINFDTLTLLAVRTEAVGCMAAYHRNVSYNKSENLCRYKIIIYECGDCNTTRVNMNYVLTKKIPDSAIFVVEVNYNGEP